MNAKMPFEIVSSGKGWVERDHPHTEGGRSFDLRLPGIHVFVHTPMNRFGNDMGYIGGGHDSLQAAMKAAEEYVEAVSRYQIKEGRRAIRTAKLCLKELALSDDSLDEEDLAAEFDAAADELERVAREEAMSPAVQELILAQRTGLRSRADSLRSPDGG